MLRQTYGCCKYFKHAPFLFSHPLQSAVLATTPPSLNGSTASRKEKVPTPIPSRECSFTHRRSSRLSSLTSTSLVSIPEVDESLLLDTPSPSWSGRKRRASQRSYAALSASFSFDDVNLPRRSLRKSVTFGPMLSPEVFDKHLPPQTPIKTGMTPRGLRRSLPIGHPSAIPEEIEPGESESDDEWMEYSMTGFDEGSSDEGDSDSETDSDGWDTTLSELLEDQSRPLPKTLPTPVRRAIQEKPTLRVTKRKLATPLREAIRGRPSLRTTKRSLPTPLKAGIRSRPVLRKTKRALATPLRKEILARPKLRKTKRSMPTPLRRGIEAKPSLRKAKRSMPTPVRKGIEAKTKLRKTKQSLATPIRKDIEAGPRLRKTRRAMATPVRRDIERRPALRRTKRSLPTPLRGEIESGPPLKKTKRSMATPLRGAIEAGLSLRKTKQSMPSPLLHSIKERPALRKTKRSMPTPVRQSIEQMPALRKTKRSMPTPVRQSIEQRPALRKTKRSMPTPVRHSIEQRPTLRKTKQSLPSLLRLAIAAKPHLRKTKRTMPTPLRDAIKQGLALRVTKQSLPLPLRSAIEAKPSLRSTKRTLPTPLREQIKASRVLRSTRKTLPANLVKDIQSKPSLHHVPVYQPGKRSLRATVAVDETPLQAPPSKRRRVANAPSPSPYNFCRFLKSDLASPVLDQAGMKALFRTPRARNTADPTDAFETRLFGSGNNVHFASPLAFTAKKVGSPKLTLPGRPLLKNAGDVPPFHIGASEPPKRRGRKPKSAKVTGAAMQTRYSTRSRAKTTEVPTMHVAPADLTEETARPRRGRKPKIPPATVKPSAAPAPPPPSRSLRTRLTAKLPIANETSHPEPAVKDARPSPAKPPARATRSQSAKGSTKSVLPPEPPQDAAAETTGRVTRSSRQAGTSVAPPPPKKSTQKKGAVVPSTAVNKTAMPSTASHAPAEQAPSSRATRSGVSVKKSGTVSEPSEPVDAPLRRSSRLRK